MNPQLRKRFCAIAAILVLAASQAFTCSFPVGYFYQVTALKGRVIGADRSSGFFGWLKSSAPIGHASLDLYEYRWPIHSQSEAPFVKAVEADAKGNFDFGPLYPGHYTLVIQGNDANDEKWRGYDRFDVEVKELPRATESVTVDVSTVHPDCSGGHEFIVNSK